MLLHELPLSDLEARAATSVNPEERAYWQAALTACYEELEYAQKMATDLEGDFQTGQTGFAEDTYVRHD